MSRKPVQRENPKVEAAPLNAGSAATEIREIAMRLARQCRKSFRRVSGKRNGWSLKRNSGGSFSRGLTRWKGGAIMTVDERLERIESMLCALGTPAATRFLLHRRIRRTWSILRVYDSGALPPRSA